MKGYMMTIEAEIALDNAIKEMRREDPLVDVKVHYWNAMMEKHNPTDLSPMQLADTDSGQKLLDEINKKVSAEMIKKFGED
jgi:hypothetical protein